MNRAKSTQVAVEEEIISSPVKSRVRDRIMKTASDLFYRHGIHAVGVDTIASEAGTNKMSFYRNFASKDDLVAEYLRAEEREGLLWWDETLAAHAGNPRLQVESLFDVRDAGLLWREFQPSDAKELCDQRFDFIL